MQYQPPLPRTSDLYSQIIVYSFSQCHHYLEDMAKRVILYAQQSYPLERQRTREVLLRIANVNLIGPIFSSYSMLPRSASCFVSRCTEFIMMKYQTQLAELHFSNREFVFC